MDKLAAQLWDHCAVFPSFILRPEVSYLDFLLLVSQIKHANKGASERMWSASAHTDPQLKHAKESVHCPRASPQLSTSMLWGYVQLEILTR